MINLTFKYAVNKIPVVIELNPGWYMIKGYMRDFFVAFTPRPVRAVRNYRIKSLGTCTTHKGIKYYITFALSKKEKA